MRKRKFGFTLIEVSIFLAVTGALFAAVTIGVQNSIYQQRYNDTVQSFVGFLENLYSEVLNVQNANENGGRSDMAIYGKLVTFGEEGDAESKQVIRVYNVIAKATNSWEGKTVGRSGTLEFLADMDANVVWQNAEGKNELVGIVEDYTPKWSAKIQNNNSYSDYVGALLIVRSAQSGTIQTYVMDGKTIQVAEVLGRQDLSGVVDVFKKENDETFLTDFESKEVDLCVNPNGDEASSTRMDVRINKNAHDASDIDVISFDSENYGCRVTNVEE